MTDPRTARLSESHIHPLMALIEDWRSEGLEVPNPDPQDGGVAASVLILLESPGPKAVRSGFISRDNPDPSARNMGASLDQAGFTRAEVLLWNVVPYCVSSECNNVNATNAQVREAAAYTQAFIDLMPNLKAVVFCGGKAKLAAQHLSTAAKCFRTYHTGAQAYNNPAYRDHIHSTFSEVRGFVSDQDVEPKDNDDGNERGLKRHTILRGWMSTMSERLR